MSLRLAFGALGLVAVCLGLSGCANTTAQLTVQPRAVAAPPPLAGGPTGPAAETRRARVFIEPIQDLRLDPTSIGHVGNRAYVDPALCQRLETALRASVEKEFVLNESAVGADLTLRPRLRKCYISNVEVTKAAVVVLEIQFQHQGEDRGSKAYRGRHTGMNWWGTDAEITGALQTAFQDCLVQIMRDTAARAKIVTG